MTTRRCGQSHQAEPGYKHVSIVRGLCRASTDHLAFCSRSNRSTAWNGVSFSCRPRPVFLTPFLRSSTSRVYNASTSLTAMQFTEITDTPLSASSSLMSPRTVLTSAVLPVPGVPETYRIEASSAAVGSCCAVEMKVEMNRVITSRSPRRPAIWPT